MNIPAVECISGPFVPTISGNRLALLEPKARDIDIRDIARGLAHTARWGGQTTHYYSIAQHSVSVAELISTVSGVSYSLELRRWALLHDAAQAYIGHITGPMRSMYPAIIGLEGIIMRVIADKFALGWPMPEEVCIANQIVKSMEARELIPGADLVGMGLDPDAPRGLIAPLSPEVAEALFLHHFMELFDA